MIAADWRFDDGFMQPLPPTNLSLLLYNPMLDVGHVRNQPATLGLVSKEYTELVGDTACSDPLDELTL